jgi:hypothetical protein
MEINQYINDIHFFGINDRHSSSNKFEIKTIILREFVKTLNENNQNNEDKIKMLNDFLNEKPLETNYYVEYTLGIFGFRTRAVFKNSYFNKTRLTFREHINLDDLDVNCLIILSQEQFNTIKKM